MRTEGAAREAENIFKMNFEKFLAAQELEEEKAKDVTEKVWQASQSDHKKSMKLRRAT